MIEYIVIGLLAVIIILLFISQKNPTTVINNNSLPEYYDDEEIEFDEENNIVVTKDFRNGISYAWSVMQVCLFKMYKQNDILDFDNLFTDVMENVQELSNNSEEMKKWNDDYIKYRDEKNKEDNK
jgi:hypothetical protein